MTWFKLSKRNVAVTLVLVALATVATWYCRSGDNVTWPQFPETKDQTPSVVVNLEPDFGYRTGDIIPVTIFVREQPGTEIDITSLALEGDFEIRGEPHLTRGQAEDGANTYCLKLELQSFSIRPRLSSSMSMTWNVKGTRQWSEIKQPLMNAFTSLTWDGERKEIQNGPLTMISGGWYTYLSVGLMVFAVALFAGCIFYQRWFERALANQEQKVRTSARMVCKRRIDAARTRIDGGEVTEANFVEIAASLREYLNLETTLLSQVPQALGNQHPYRKRIQASINLCERVAYKSVKLTATELMYLYQFLDEILLRQNGAAERDPDHILNRPKSAGKAKAKTAAANDQGKPATDAAGPEFGA